MYSKYFALLVLSVLFMGGASAQEYSIRVNRGLNLRAAPSLNADITDTVTSGSILQVVGKTNRWLQINRNGRQVWLADWVNFSRVDSSQPATPIDNCCFVDRQCQSEAEWEAGYWAFQNKQCAAPSQPKPATSANAPSGSSPSIEGSQQFVRHIAATLNWMQQAAPEWHHYVISGMDVIAEVPVPIPDVGGRVITCTAAAYDRQRKVTLETCFMTWTIWGTGPVELDQVNTAAALAHEACHIHLHEAGINFATQELEELECRKYGTGGMASLALAFEQSLGSTFTWFREGALSLIRRYCSEGLRPELFCPLIQRLPGG
ncbi:MAG: SH3 domain-containing protein [Chloroflexi bacterium]|nr:SH3 domain-containing protein [Chloroflexota bacterium]MCY4247646.1 SH3 domain-containing protein [Chloroflexota bacterium]